MTAYVTAHCPRCPPRGSVGVPLDCANICPECGWNPYGDKPAGEAATRMYLQKLKKEEDMKEVKVKVGEWWVGKSSEEREVIFLPQGGNDAVYWNHRTGIAGDAPLSDKRFWHWRIKDEHGNPVDPEPAADRRCEIDWEADEPYIRIPQPNGSEFIQRLSACPFRRDFTAFEAENGGSRCLSSPYWMILKDIDGKETISTCSWYDPSGRKIKRVRAKWVILEVKS